MTEQQIYLVQAAAAEADDFELLCAAYAALGVSRRYAFVAVSDWERRRGLDACAAWLARHAPQRENSASK